VHAGLNGGKGINGAGCLVSGTENLPNIGKPGMLFEFDSGDAGGPRSSAGYAYGGFRTNLTNHIVLLAGGYWKDDARGHECLDRMSVGIPDLYYKLEHGYRDYSKGKPEPDVFKPLKDWDCEMALALSEKVLRPLHGR